MVIVDVLAEHLLLSHFQIGRREGQNWSGSHVDLGRKNAPSPPPLGNVLNV